MDLDPWEATIFYSCSLYLVRTGIMAGRRMKWSNICRTPNIWSLNIKGITDLNNEASYSVFTGGARLKTYLDMAI